MLILSRKVNESIEIRPQAGAELVTLAEAFAHGAIQISLVRVGTGRIKVAIDAPPELRIWRTHQPSSDAEAAAETAPVAGPRKSS